MTDSLTPSQRRQFDKNRIAYDHNLADREAVEVKLATARKRLADALADVESISNGGGTTRQLVAAEKRLVSVETIVSKLEDRQIRLARNIDKIRDRLDHFEPAVVDPARLLSGAVPLALLPVRLETRFIGSELRIRIFPDTIHVDQLEPLLTADEEQHGQAYWTARWNVAADGVSACWDRFTSGYSPQRVAWIVERTTPTNVADIGQGDPEFPTLPIRPAGPSRSPVARLLPGRFVAVGMRAGNEVFRVWSQPVATDLPVGIAPSDPTVPVTTDPPDVQAEIALPDAGRWLVDYDRADAAGMAITVRAGDVMGSLTAGFDRLIVVGVDHRRDPAGSAAALEDLLRAHHATDGVGFVPVGTATNAVVGSDIPGRPVVRDPSVAPAPLGPDAAAPTAARALGLSITGVLARVDGAEHQHDPLAAAMITALWEPTLGYYTRQMLEPIASPTRVAQLRDHVLGWVRPRGPLPIARVGRQPLALLPIVAPGAFTGSDAERFVADVLRAVRPLWQYSAGSALRLGGSGDPAADLVELLERTEHSIAHRLRQAFGSVTLGNTEGAQAAAQLQQAASQLALTMIGVRGRPNIVDVMVDEDDFVAPIPLVTAAALSDTAPLDPDYVARVASRAATRGGYQLLRLADPEQAASLLEALLLHAANLEISKASIGLIVDHFGLDIDIDQALIDAEFRPMDVADRTARSGAVSVVDAGRPTARLDMPIHKVPELRVTGVSGRVSIESFLADQTIEQLGRVRRTRQLGEFRDALALLTGQPTARLHRSAAETLDAVSYRYDAWATSLATRRLAQQRDTTPTGVHIGAFGWVDDLRPAGARASAGHVHGPSIPHVSAAAILRSGHLGRNDAQDDALAIDLSSRRVRDAMRLVEGLRAGQPLGALLGYRYERGLRDRGAVYAAYILPSRLAHPLPGSGDADATGVGPVEAIAARNVVDGIALAELDAAGRGAFLSAIGVTPSHRSAVEGLLDELAGSLDAVADLLVAEGVFQSTVGNAERAAAAMDALDRQLPVPDPGIARTPRSGTTLAHRILILLDDDRPPAAWDRLTDIRGAAEPRVNAWVGRALGAPTRFRLAVDAIDATGVIVTTLTADLTALAMSPLSVVLAASQGAEQVSELEERLWSYFAERAPANTILRARPDPPPRAPSGSAGLRELITLARGIADVISTVRSAEVTDFAHPNDRYEPTPDTVELAARADAVVAENEILAALPDDLSPLNLTQLTHQLMRAANLGVRGAIPRDRDRVALTAQLERVVSNARLTRERLVSLDAAFGLVTHPTPHQVANHHTARIQAVLGTRVPVVRRHDLPSDLVARLDASLSDAELLDKRPHTVTEWMLQHCRVRPAIERLYAVLAASEARAGELDATKFAVAQLPTRRGDPWIGREAAFAVGAPARVADTSLVVHRTASVGSAIGARVAALVVDQWTEEVPGSSETTGVSFHFDGPGARAPQTVLLAVHPDPAATAWTTDLVLETVAEAAELTRIRTLDLDDVTGAGCFLPAIYLAFNLERQVPTFDLSRLIANSVESWKSWRTPT